MVNKTRKFVEFAAALLELSQKANVISHFIAH